MKIPITDDYPNADWFGPHIPRDGGARDPETRLWVGGQPTPWSITYEEVGKRISMRFRTEGITGEELRNRVHLCDGAEVDGNRIVRGEKARQLIRDMLQKSSALGIDISNARLPGPDEFIVTTATAADRQLIRQDVFRQLAAPGKFTVETWADAAYKIFQSPEMKSGSDSVSRTFLAAAAECRMGRVPAFPHDIDLRAMTMSQQDFLKYIVEHDLYLRNLSVEPDIRG